MDFIEQQSMLIITHSGMSKSFAVEAIQKAKEHSFEEADALIKQAEEEMGNAGKAHHDTLVKSGEPDFKVTLLLAHAEDQMLTSETTIILAKEIIVLHKTIKEKM